LKNIGFDYAKCNFFFTQQKFQSISDQQQATILKQ